MAIIKQTSFFLAAIFLISSCRVNEQETVFSAATELGQQVGDMMSSVDESASSSGDFTFYQEMDSAQKSIAFWSPTKKISPTQKIGYFFSSAVSQVVADSCFGAGFSPCSAGTFTRDFNNCSMNGALFSGSVIMTFAGPSAASCRLMAAGDAVKRNPNFLMSNSVGSVAVTKTGTNGQVLSYVSGLGASKVFSLTSDGIRRTVTVNSEVKQDVTTSTVSAMTVTGSSRSNRTINGGVFRINNNLTSERCDIAPTAVTWSGSCTCATSGIWSGSCETSGAFNLEIRGCGTALLTLGSSAAKEIVLNRCAAL